MTAWHSDRDGFGWLGALALIIMAGCGDGGRYRVTGTVTFDGHPVPAGMIYFHPDKASGNDRPSGFAEIVGGKFDTALGRGRGAGPGSHEVMISGHDPATSVGSDFERGALSLFDNYRETVDLPAAASRHDFAVPPEAAQQRGY
jgi:hypothetical protein